MGGSCPKNPKVTENFQQTPLKAKGGEAWFVVANFWCQILCCWDQVMWGNSQVMVFLWVSTRQLLFVLTKGRVLGTDFSSSKVPILAKRRWIAVGSSCRARSPHPCQAAIAEGAECPTQLVSSLLRPPKWGRPGSRKCDPGRKSQRQGRESGSLLPQGLGQG